MKSFSSRFNTVCLNLLWGMALLLALPFPLSAKSHKNYKQWTIAFYLAVDNSMEYAQANNFEEITRAADCLKQANIVIFFDRDEKFTRDNPNTSWKGTRRFWAQKGFKYTLQHPVKFGIPKTIGTCAISMKS